MNKAVGYIRISTDKDRQANSLLAQPETIRTYAEANGLELVDIVQDEESAYKVPFFERPGGKKIAALIKAGKVQHIVGAKLDRIFRNTRDGLATEEWLRVKNIALHVIDNGGTMNTRTAMGYMFFTVALAMATFEPMRISERTKEALAVMRKNGKRTGKIRYGFVEDDGVMVEIPEEMEIVREIQTRVAGGEELKAITNDLNARGIPTREAGKMIKYRGVSKKSSGKWHVSTVRQIARRTDVQL